MCAVINMKMLNIHFVNTQKNKCNANDNILRKENERNLNKFELFTIILTLIIN